MNVLVKPRSIGGRRESANVELVHNFTLLHDDVMDRDATRRHRPTSWTVFGIADAVLAGDALLALAARILAEDPHPAAPQASARLHSCVIELCEGQHADCACERRAVVSVDECTAMAAAKTGALLGCACALGALYGGAGPGTVQHLDAFGRRLGLAFQCIDDLLGIWGDPALTGKSAGSDLACRKKSLPVAAALASRTSPGGQLADLYGSPGHLKPEELQRAADLVEAAGGRARAREQATVQLAAALDSLRAAVPDPDRVTSLNALAGLITRRNH